MEYLIKAATTLSVSKLRTVFSGKGFQNITVLANPDSNRGTIVYLSHLNI